MPTCHKGHESSAVDYCSECGTRLSEGAAEPPAAQWECPQCREMRTGRFCERCRYDVERGEANPAGPLPPPRAAVPAWTLVATADRDFYEAMQARGWDTAEPVEFPPYCPERRFVLHGEEVLVGRSRHSHGIEPHVDLTGPPQDPAVSHAHALLVAGPDGSWAVVDLGSANGTYVNDMSAPIEPRQPRPLRAGDRIHLGAWTTLTVSPGSTGSAGD